MSTLWLPEQAEAQIHAEYSSRAEAKRVQDFTDRVQALDPRLWCVLATQDSPDGEIKQGFYYIARKNEDGTVATWQIQNADGSFREPDERDIEALRVLDLRNERARREWKARQTQARRARERERERRREDRKAQVVDLADYRFRTQAPVAKDIA